MKVRADQLLVSLGLAPSRAKAQALILAGKVFVGEVRVEKPGATIPEDAALEVRGQDHPFVSRGGVKLAGALDAFGIDPRGLFCVDIGASTGGFTDCLLSRGALRVAAVDVGYGQLAHKLRVDPRVLVLERTNARSLTVEQIGREADLVVVDASFIGLGKLLPAIATVTKPGGELVALIKPQFEVGKVEASKARGVVKDEAARARAIAGVVEEAETVGFDVVRTVDSSLAGPKGNVEAFVHAKKRRISANSNGDE